MSARITLTVTIEPPVPTIMVGWNGHEFQVRSIKRDYYFRDGGWTPQRIKATGKRIKKDGSPSTVGGESDWGQVFSPEVHRQLRAGAESAIKAAAKATIS
jgi:hypothetical protein